MHFSSWLPFLSWPRLTPALARNEMLSGVTIGLMLLPQGVAYAALAGMPLVTGIYAALLPSLVAVLWGASPRLGVGPTALTSLLIGTSLAGMAEPGSAQWVTLAAWLALMAGAVQWLLGALRGGWLVNLVTSPVLNGFTQAAGILILLSQLPDLLGLRSTWSALLHAPSLHHFDGLAALFGLSSFALLLLLKRLAPRWPAAIMVIALCAAASAALGFAERGGEIVGHLPAGLPSLFIPSVISAEQVSRLLLPVLMISLVSFLEVASSAQAEHRKVGTRWNENQDLVAQGMAKVVAGFSGTFPISGSFSRSAVTLNSGAKSGWATVFAIGMVLVSVLWLMPVLYHVPQATLAAVVVSAVLNLIQPRTLGALFRISRVEGSIALTTFALTLATAPRLYWGVLTGVMLSLCHFLYQRLHPRILEIGEHADGSLRSRSIWNLPPLAPHVLALRMDAEWDFASASALERYIADALQQRSDVQMLYLDAHSINRIDVTGVESFFRLRQSLQKQGISLHIGGLKLPVEAILQKAGALVAGPDLHLYRTNTQALTCLRETGTA
ncbi:MAG: SulP family inorganic anion transporter [Comamonadaceae bacterium]|nr:SulP family inorganic anion transporter [Comamonadaceae bacterium]